MSQREQMTQMFEAIDSDSRRYVLAILRGEFERAQRMRRPVLRLVDNDRPTPCKTTAPTREGRNDG